MLVNLPNGKRALVAGQKWGVVHAVDPDQQGEFVGRRASAKAERRAEWNGVRPPTIRTSTSPCPMLVTSGPRPALPPIKQFLVDMEYIDPAAGGGMFALSASTGERVWLTPPPPCGDRKGCSPAQSAAVTVIPGVVFSGDLGGRLHAYSTKDGAILWETETAHEFETVNGVKATGGAMDGPGAAIVGGRLYVNSGYDLTAGCREMYCWRSRSTKIATTQPKYERAHRKPIDRPFSSEF